ncbi:hypothetical protein [Phocaeicola plebeius]|uniref:hypothetical protein n=1 Tax=Phocaeicola plebeius TaxID=310297 RepID=UPI00399457E8
MNNMVPKIYYLNEASTTGICILLVLKLLFPEIIAGTWFVSAVVILMAIILYCEMNRKKEQRPLLYTMQRELFLTPFLWFYYYYEKALFIVAILCFFTDSDDSPLVMFMPFILGIYIGLKVAVNLIEYAIQKDRKN